MNELLQSIATILEVEAIQSVDNLKSFPQWDSLAVLSIIAMLDANYGVNLRAADFAGIKSAGDLWNLIQAKKDVQLTSQPSGA